MTGRAVQATGAAGAKALSGNRFSRVSIKRQRLEPRGDKGKWSEMRRRVSRIPRGPACCVTALKCVLIAKEATGLLKAGDTQSGWCFRRWLQTDWRCERAGGRECTGKLSGGRFHFSFWTEPYRSQWARRRTLCSAFCKNKNVHL